MDTTALQQRKAYNATAQEKLRTELADIARTAPADRSPAQNDRLQAIEIERQKLVEDAEAINAEMAKGDKKHKP